MRRLALLVTVSSVITCPAFAQNTGFYVAGELGAVISAESEQTYTPGTVAGSTGAISTDHDLGFGGGALAGYDFGAFRVEAEAAYLTAGIDKLTSNFATGGGLATGSQDSDGDIRAQILMANAMADFVGLQDFSFFAGGGIGVAKLKVSEMTAANGAFVVLDDEDSDWRSAWQLFAGVRKPLTSNIDAHLRYRYLNTEDFEMTGMGGRVVNADFTAHTLTAGVSFSF